MRITFATATWSCRCELTTHHSASSYYGVPVVVIASIAYTPADLETRWPGYHIEGSKRARLAAQRAGYRVVEQG